MFELWVGTILDFIAHSSETQKERRRGNAIGNYVNCIFKIHNLIS